MVRTSTQMDPLKKLRGGPGDFIRLLRPRQWTKNLLLYAPLLLSGQFLHAHPLLKVSIGFVLFCLMSGVGYILNDILDSEQDRRHPVKCRRPIASGRVHKTQAIVFAASLFLITLAGAYTLGVLFLLAILAYFVLTISYSLYLKHRPVIDVFTISFGFMLRAIAGSILLLGIDAHAFSPWFLMTVALLSQFLGFAKRRGELSQFQEEAHHHRQSLRHYSLHFLDQTLTMLVSATLICYAISAISSPVAQKHPLIAFTIFPTLYGLVRYLYQVFHLNAGGRPEELLLTDKHIAASVFAWVCVVVACYLL